MAGRRGHLLFTAAHPSTCPCRAPARSPRRGTGLPRPPASGLRGLVALQEPGWDRQGRRLLMAADAIVHQLAVLTRAGKGGGPHHLSVWQTCSCRRRRSHGLRSRARTCGSMLALLGQSHLPADMQRTASRSRWLALGLAAAVLGLAGRGLTGQPASAGIWREW